jgi:hypothetical protein
MLDKDGQVYVKSAPGDKDQLELEAQVEEET